MTGITKPLNDTNAATRPIAGGLTLVPGPAMQFSAQEKDSITRLNKALAKAYLTPGTEQDHQLDYKVALRRYLETMTLLGRRHRMFEIANHRLLKTEDCLIVPYDAHGSLTIYRVCRDSEKIIRQLRLPHGTLTTDALFAELTGTSGTPVDLEREIYHLHVDDMPNIQVARLRDLAVLLQRLNSCGSRHEAVYILRFLVARLCSSSYRGMPGAKNLKPEISRVRSELAEFMNGPFAERLRLPTSILVRSISGLVSQPKLIDEVWQDTIDLSEVQVPGSAISNEIRRSTHHAMGKHTLKLARAYLHWMTTGEANFPDPEREKTGAADEAARLNPAVIELVKRIISNLEQLLGSAQIARRLNEWRDAYARELLSCESSYTFEEELEALVTKGIQANNPWVYQQRLRNMINKISNCEWAEDICEPFKKALQGLQEDGPGKVVANGKEEEVRQLVTTFCAKIRHDHQDALFLALDELLELYSSEDQFGAFERSCSLRREFETLVGNGVFTTQRYLLHQLDCIVEELGFFALRHVASGYMEQGVKLKECLSIIHLCAGNLDRDGLFSRELWDLSAMLVNPFHDASEILDVLEQIQRNYHRLIHRVSHAYEVMAERLGYGPDEMRAVLANFQRTMHDLNSLVHFSDLARTCLSESPHDDTVMETAGKGEDPWDFLHLSHTSDIKRRVEDPKTTSLQDCYGGKGSGLIYIAYLGIPTRDGFIIPTTLPHKGLHKSEPQRLHAEVLKHVRLLEADIERNEGRRPGLGNPDAPLLLAVRGGSAFSMPGMLSTMVFVGMNDRIAEALALEDEWYAWDAYRRFLVSFSAAVWNFDLEAFDLVEKAKRRHAVTLKTDLSGGAMREVVEASKDAIRAAGHADQLQAILSDLELQLQTAINAVHASWGRDRARQYRAIKHLSEGWHTAVTVQQMASGNRINKQELKQGIDEMRISLTGVIPNTRMKTTGFREFTGDIKFSASGDDLVGGITAAKSFESVQRLHTLAPMLERKLNHVGARLRRFLGSDAEIEFTVDQGVLSVLQARSAQVNHRFSPRSFEQPGSASGRGIGISGSAFRGRVAFNEADVRRLADETGGRSDESDGILLVLENPVPDEIPLILSVDGLLAARGGSTSHAAVCVHGVDEKRYTAVLGVPELHVSKDKATLVRSDGEIEHTILVGDILSIHGQSGDVFVGTRPILEVNKVAEKTESART